MKDYIWKFLAVIFSLNLFLSGIASSMMKMPRILENIIKSPFPGGLYDQVTHEEIPVGGIDKEETLSDGTVLHYISRETIKKNVEKYKNTIESLDEKQRLREDNSFFELFSPSFGLLIGLIGSYLSHSTNSDIPFYIGSIFGYVPSSYALVRNIHRAIYGKWTRENPRYFLPFSKQALIGPGAASEYVVDYPYGIVIVQRPEGKNKQFGVNHDKVYPTGNFYKDKLIEEISKGY